MPSYKLASEKLCRCGTLMANTTISVWKQQT